MKKIIILSILALLIASVWHYTNNPLGTKAIIRGKTIYLEIAATPQEKSRGLGGRDSLAMDHGMVFPFDHKEQYGFWMNDMRFPLDFLWMDGNTIVDITKNVPNPTGKEKPKMLQPKVPVDKVLEVNAGVIDTLGVNVGDTITFKN